MIYSGIREAGMGVRRSMASICCVLIAAALCGCGEREAKVITSKTFSVMGEDGLVAVPQARASELEVIAISTKSTMEELERVLSIYEPDSNITKINQVAGHTRIPIAFDTYRLLDHALEYSELSGGAFDITVAPLSSLWGFRGGRVPDQPISKAVLRATLQAVGSNMIELDDKSIRLLSPFSQIDPSSILPGYAVDIALLKERQRGVRDLFIRLGNSSRTLGVEAPGKRWPFEVYLDKEQIVHLGTVGIPAANAMSVRRRDDNFLVINGIHYSEIIDPRTGIPVTRTLLAATFGPVATMTDALAVALLVGGIEEAPEILRQFPRCEAMLIPAGETLAVWVTPKFSQAFRAAADFENAVQVLESPDTLVK
ncbi:MAG: FAD:protein FMN transferase [Verrucomicrobia bacterium]|nr:FAD:protein FMN transferase [Verrucomicrobiota bacterium]